MLLAVSFLWIFEIHVKEVNKTPINPQLAISHSSDNWSEFRHKIGGFPSRREMCREVHKGTCWNGSAGRDLWTSSAFECGLISGIRQYTQIYRVNDVTKPLCVLLYSYGNTGAWSHSVQTMATLLRRKARDRGSLLCIFIDGCSWARTHKQQQSSDIWAHISSFVSNFLPFLDNTQRIDIKQR